MQMKGKYFFLSNFYPCRLTLVIDGKTCNFSNSEAAFQAQKNYSVADRFSLIKPLEAKRLGAKLKITTPNWDSYRLYAMANALYAKFSQNPELYAMLKEVKEEIVEDNYWGDTYWGVCTNKQYKHEGKNMLGKLLMFIRDNKFTLEDMYIYIKNTLEKE